jgi:uncharacterized protein YbjT (DUF2867 family)
MHLILTGATGLVGSACLKHILATPNVTELSVLSRRPIPAAMEHPQVRVILHEDFSKYDASVVEQLKGAQGCIWALGVSQNDVDKEYVTWNFVGFVLIKPVPIPKLRLIGR